MLSFYKSKLHYILTCILTLGFITSSYSQMTTGTVNGTVKTSDGKPAEYVIVTIKGSQKGAVVNSSGFYEIKNIAPGSYLLTTSLMGLESKEIAVVVNSGETTTVPEITLLESEMRLHEIIITAYKSANEKPTEIGKISIKPLDLPQSVSIIEKHVMEQQQTLRMSDVLKNINGVYIMGTTGGSQEEIAGRGFAFNSSNTFKNGVRFNNGAMPEMSSLESIEVMKGSSAILFGNVAPGGVINLITKKPNFQSGGEISMRVGSNDFYKPAIDLYGVINKRAAYRINTSYEKTHSFRDVVQSERFYITPSLLLKPSKKLTILLEGDYLNDNRTNDYGIGSINYQLIDIPRSRYLGTAWSYNKTEQKSFTSTSTYILSGNWSLRNISSYQNYVNDLFGNTRPNNSGQFVKANGNWIRGIQRTAKTEEYYLSELDLNGKFSTGFIKHNLLVGVDADKYNTETEAYKPIAVYDSINIFDLSKYKQRNDIPDLVLNTTITSPVKRVGAYIQDLISFTDKIKLLAGVRITYMETFGKVLTNTTGVITETKLFDHALTPRLGIVYQPLKTMAVFASYANSFVLNTGLDINGKVLAPSYINQYEAGIKNDFCKGLFSVNATVYQIINSNLVQTSLANGNTNTNIKELAGEVTSKGVELDILSKPYKGFSFIGGYSYNDTRYTKSNTYITGSRLLYNPAHTGNSSIYYTFNHNKKFAGFNIGAGVFYVGKRDAGRSTRIQVANDTFKPFALPDYTLLDITMGYAKNKMAIRVKLSNVFNVLSYNVHDDNSVNPISPRQLAATLSFKL